MSYHEQIQSIGFKHKQESEQYDFEFLHTNQDTENEKQEKLKNLEQFITSIKLQLLQKPTSDGLIKKNAKN